MHLVFGAHLGKSTVLCRSRMFTTEAKIPEGHAKDKCFLTVFSTRLLEAIGSKDCTGLEASSALKEKAQCCCLVEWISKARQTGQ